VKIWAYNYKNKFKRHKQCWELLASIQLNWWKLNEKAVSARDFLMTVTFTENLCRELEALCNPTSWLSEQGLREF
jgi:hypothetical protein